VAKERARKRAEREAAKVVEREKRARRRVRRERVERGRRAVASLVPDAPKRTPGLLARRRRRRMMAFGLGIVAICALTWPFLPSWTARIVVLVLALLAAPVVWVLSFGRV
jgi:Flp pilus assembly protein TadB